MTERPTPKPAWLLAALLLLAPAARASCADAPLQLQMLGIDTPASASTLVWIDGRARLLRDAGPGVAGMFAANGATIDDIDLLLLTHLRAERTAGLPALVQLAADTRTHALPVYGPADNRWMPSTVTFVRALFDPNLGAWRHLGDSLNPLARTPFKLQPQDLRRNPPRIGVTRPRREDALSVYTSDRLRVSALATLIARAPAMHWAIETRGKRVVLLANGADDAGLLSFVRDADALVAYADPQEMEALTRLAREGRVKQLILVPLTRTTDRDALHARAARDYKGKIEIAGDACLTP